MTRDQFDITTKDLSNHLRAVGAALEHALESSTDARSSKNEITSAVIDVELAYEVVIKLAAALHAGGARRMRKDDHDRGAHRGA